MIEFVVYLRPYTKSVHVIEIFVLCAIGRLVYSRRSRICEEIPRGAPSSGANRLLCSSFKFCFKEMFCCGTIDERVEARSLGFL